MPGRCFGMWTEGLGAEYREYLWAVECKYRKRPMSLVEVKKRMETAEAFRQTEYQKREQPLALQVWAVSTGGFTADALTFIRENKIYYSGYAEINELFRYYGGRVNIPEGRGD
jgi:hypothetical protein